MLDPMTRWCAIVLATCLACETMGQVSRGSTASPTCKPSAYSNLLKHVITQEIDRIPACMDAVRLASHETHEDRPWCVDRTVEVVGLRCEIQALRSALRAVSELAFLCGE